jgi:hypothetical protein
MLWLTICKKRLSWDEIIDNVGKTSYSDRSLKYERSEAVKSLAIALYGSKVFEEDSNKFRG